MTLGKVTRAITAPLNNIEVDPPIGIHLAAEVEAQLPALLDGSRDSKLRKIADATPPDAMDARTNDARLPDIVDAKLPHHVDTIILDAIEAKLPVVI